MFDTAKVGNMQCYRVYGFEARMTKPVLPYAHLIVDLMTELESNPVKELVDIYGGMLFFRMQPCCPTDMCDLCKKIGVCDRQNIHNFISIVYKQCKNLNFQQQLQLVRFVSTHRSKLFEKISPHSNLPPHLRLKPV